MEDIQKFKKLIDENYNSPSKRVLADLVLACIQRIDKLELKLDNLNELRNISPQVMQANSNPGFLKEVSNVRKGETQNVNSDKTS